MAQIEQLVATIKDAALRDQIAGEFKALKERKQFEDDPFTRPDLGQLLGMTPPAS